MPPHNPALVAGAGILMEEKQYWVYILTDDRNKIFYTGLTDDRVRRTYEHKMGIHDGFTKTYRVHKLVYFERCKSFAEAEHREKIIKKWKCVFKINAIERMNPHWDDLYFVLNRTSQQVRGKR